jgi:hypothetical protein
MICSRCGSAFEEGQFCRKCGSRLVDPEARTVAITERTGQAAMDKSDILIEIKRELRTHDGVTPFVIIYADVDREYELPPGSTEQYIELAAQQSDVEIIDKGSTRGELRRPVRTTRRRVFGERG